MTSVRIIGGGWYGCHLASALLESGYQVELHEVADHLFAGASGANPARLHLGFHYPRSRLTRALCQEHYGEFMALYGHLTRAVPVNLYAVAERDSLVDFGTYKQVLQNEVEFVTVENPGEFGLRGVEGAVLTGERHILIRLAREHFAKRLSGVVRYGMPPETEQANKWDWTIDCTFCALDGAEVDRYEPCLVVVCERTDGANERAVTIMDGPFPSLYPWDEDRGLASLTSARYTPFSKTCRTREEAQAILDGLSEDDIHWRSAVMAQQMSEYWPAFLGLYEPVDYRLSVRAMPSSAADARLVNVQQTGNRLLRVRAGKIDAVLHAERLIREYIEA